MKNKPAVSSLEAFEEEAELFYKDTGFLAPGKSEPLDSGQYDFERDEVRRLMKKAWDAGRRRVNEGPSKKDAAFAAMKEALENIENDDGRIPKNIWAMRNDALKQAQEADKE